MKNSLILLLAILFATQSAFAAQKNIDSDKCSLDGAVYAPTHTSGDGRYELVVEQNRETSDYIKTGIPGGENRRFHLNLYDPKTNVLLTTATLSHVCTANGVIYCYTVMKGVKNMDVVFLNKDFTGRVKDAPYAIIFPNMTSNFYYGYKESDNPNLKYYRGDTHRISLPPSVYLRQKCGSPRKH
ncbi:MAG: hypothetical protein ACAH83_03935 [Alphaproteobacteria bacterium]